MDVTEDVYTMEMFSLAVPLCLLPLINPLLHRGAFLCGEENQNATDDGEGRAWIITLVARKSTFEKRRPYKERARIGHTQSACGPNTNGIDQRQCSGASCRREGVLDEIFPGHDFGPLARHDLCCTKKLGF